MFLCFTAKTCSSNLDYNTFYEDGTHELSILLVETTK